MARRKRSTFPLVWASLLGVSVLACRGPQPPSPQAAATSTPSTSASASPSASASSVAVAVPDAAANELQPLAEPKLTSLALQGFQPVLVHVPVGARTPRPIVVALHGNFDRADWQCGIWGEYFQERAFIVCPQGILRTDVPRSWDRWEYASQKAVKAELTLALAAVEQRFGKYLAAAPRVLLGFSLGAIYGAPIAREASSGFSRLVLIEGGQAGWSTHTAKQFVARGGERVLFACGQSACLNQAKGLTPLLTRAGLPTRFGGNAKEGHTYTGGVAQVVIDNMDWLLEPGAPPSVSVPQ